MTNRVRRLARGGATLVVVAGAVIGVTGCTGSPECAPGEATEAPDDAIAVASVAQGTVGALDDLRIGFANAGC
ncbi:MAG: hypothetical protein ACTH31_06200, partial [Pseudoclavibacter sp.]